MSGKLTLLLIPLLIVTANSALIRLTRAVPVAALNVGLESNITSNGDVIGSADPAESSIPTSVNVTEASAAETEEPPEADEIPSNSTITDQQQPDVEETEEPPENEMDPTPASAIEAQGTTEEPDEYYPYPPASTYELPPWWSGMYSNRDFWYYYWN